MSSSPRIVLLTGAGISTAAGIPDFRGPDGVWTRDPKAELTSTLSCYLKDPGVRERAWQQRVDSDVWTKTPTPAHGAIAAAERDGSVVGIITQNVDGLHQRAGSSASSVVEIHGSVRAWRCEDCAAGGEMLEMIARVRAGERDPDCPDCHGIVRATTILFEELLDPLVLDAAVELAEAADVFIAVGTSLTVQPAASLFPLAVENGARGFVVNAEPTPFDHIAEAVLSGDIQAELPSLLRALSS